MHNLSRQFSFSQFQALFSPFSRRCCCCWFFFSTLFIRWCYYVAQNCHYSSGRRVHIMHIFQKYIRMHSCSWANKILISNQRGKKVQFRQRIHFEKVGIFWLHFFSFHFDIKHAHTQSERVLFFFGLWKIVHYKFINANSMKNSMHCIRKQNQKQWQK